MSGDFDWVKLGKEGETLGSGAGNLAAPPVAGPCELVLASDLVLLERMAAPARQQRRLGSALRYLAEELVLSDPERQHVASAPGPDRNTVCLGIVDRQWLRGVLDKLGAAGLQAVAAYPESLMPALLPHTWTVVWQGTEGFVRTGESEAVTLDVAQDGGPPSNLRLALEQSRASGNSPSAIVLRCTRQGALPEVEKWAEMLGVPVEAGPEWHWMHAQRCPVLELLQGEFAVRGGMPPWLPRLRRPALMATVLLALGSLALGLDWGAKVRERDALLEEMRGVYRDTFGDRATIVDAPLQMSRALTDLRQRAGQVGPGDFLALVGTAADLLPDTARQNVESLAYDGAALTVTLRPATASEGAALLEALRNQAPPAGYELTVREAPSGGGLALRLGTRRGP